MRKDKTPEVFWKDRQEKKRKKNQHGFNVKKEKAAWFLYTLTSLLVYLKLTKNNESLIVQEVSNDMHMSFALADKKGVWIYRSEEMALLWSVVFYNQGFYHLTFVSTHSSTIASYSLTVKLISSIFYYWCTLQKTSKASNQFSISVSGRLIPNVLLQNLR